MVTLCLAVHGCDQVSGGAVELSWKLRPASSGLSDKFVDCDSGSDPGVGGKQPVARIRLHWQVDAQQGSQSWRCADNHGVTGFDLPAGTAQLWVTPECVDGDTPATTSYISPARVERTVSVGDTVSLGAVELIVAVSYCGPAMGATQPCICALPTATVTAR